MGAILSLPQCDKADYGDNKCQMIIVTEWIQGVSQDRYNSDTITEISGSAQDC